MCLAIPGEVKRWLEREPPFCEAEVEFLGVRRICNLSCVPEAEVGDYVIVHAGVAISLVDTGEAAKLLAELSRAEIEAELRGDSP
jgi:hydrogenase expression/formation protein HypC